MSYRLSGVQRERQRRRLWPTIVGSPVDDGAPVFASSDDARRPGRGEREARLVGRERRELAVSRRTGRRDRHRAREVDDRSCAAAVDASRSGTRSGSARDQELVAGRGRSYRPSRTGRIATRPPSGSRVSSRRSRSSTRGDRAASPSGCAAVLASGSARIVPSSRRSHHCAGASAVDRGSRATESVRVAIELRSTTRVWSNVDASSDGPFWSSIVTWPSGRRTSVVLGSRGASSRT